MFQIFWRNKKLTRFFFFSLLLPTTLNPTTSDSRTGVERGLQDLWQEQERLHRGQRAKVSYDDLGPEVDRRGVPGVLERGRPERRRETGLQWVHQDHAAVLNVPFVVWPENFPQLLHLIENDTSDQLNKINYLNFFFRASLKIFPDQSDWPPVDVNIRLEPVFSLLSKKLKTNKLIKLFFYLSPLQNHSRLYKTEKNISLRPPQKLSLPLKNKILNCLFKSST